MRLHVSLVAYQELAGEELRNDARALRGGVDEVGSDHGWMMAVPARHGSVAAHGLISVEEAAASLLGDALLDGDDLRDGAHGVDLVAVAFATVHRAHDEDGGVGECGADTADGADEFAFILFFDVRGESGLVGAVVDDDEVGVAMLERGGEGCGTEGSGHDGGRGSVEADAVVGEAAAVAAEDDPKELDGAARNYEFDLFGSGGYRDCGGGVVFCVRGGVDGACGCTVGVDFEAAAVGFGEVFDLDGGGVLRCEANSAGCADGAGEDGSAEAIVGFAHGADGGVDLPTGGGDVDVVMAVPGPGLGDEDEAGAGVSEPFLKKLAGVAGDEVGGSWRVAVVDDADGAAGFSGAEIAERLIEVVEHAVAVDEELGVEGGVGGYGGVVADFGPRDGEDGWDWGRGDFGYGKDGGFCRGEGGDGAEGCWVQAFAGADSMNDEEDRGEGCRGEHRLDGEFGHGYWVVGILGCARTDKSKSEMRGSLHCAADDRTVRRFGRDDALC
jgi:hypothetical protein